MKHFKGVKYRIGELRTERNMKQTEFADFLGISRQSIGFYESGKRLPDASTIALICKKCNVSADWLLDLGGVKSDNVNEAAIGKLTGLSPKAVRWMYGQKKKIDSAETDLAKYGSLSLADLISFAIEYFPNNSQQAQQNIVEAIFDCALINDEKKERLYHFLHDDESSPMVDHIRFFLGADIISTEQKKELCTEITVKMYRTIIESYIERRGSELKSILDEIRAQEGGQNNAIDTEEKD